MLTLDQMAWEACAAEFAPKPPLVRRWASPLDMACDLDPTMVRTPALEGINAAIVDLADDKIPGNRLAVFMPPQEGKSTLCSKWTPLWLLACVSPEFRIIDISYAAELARGWGSEVKLTLENFSGDEDTVDLGLRLRPDQRAAGRWQLEGHRGGIYCAGINGTITGKPGDWIFVDDPLKGLEEAQSDKIRAKVASRYRSAIIPRLSPGAKMLWVQTLWHESEPIADILKIEVGKWRVIRIPAISDSPDDPLGRPIGEAMISARGDRDWDAIRTAVGAFVFSAVYQQSPAPVEGGLFKRLWWRYWSLVNSFAASTYTLGRLDLGGKIVMLEDTWRFITADLAVSTKTSADWTVASVWALSLDGDLILLDRTRAKVGEEGHFAMFRPLAERWKIDTAFVEKSQHSTTLVTEATQSGLHITPLDADTDKFTRALPASARASGGRVWLPAGALWIDEWVGEHASFPNGSHDDQVDTLGYAARVAITKWSPKPLNPLPAPRSAEIDFMNVPL